MQFAELTQEVQIERTVEVKVDNGLAPGRRRANEVFKEAVKRLEENGEVAETVDMSPALVYSLGSTWPPLDVEQFDQDEVMQRLGAYLKKRINTRKTLLEDYEDKQNKFRDFLAKQEEELLLLRAENKKLKTQLQAERRKTTSYEQKIVSAEAANRNLIDKVAAYEDMKQILENELDEKEIALNAEHRNNQKTKRKFQVQIESEREKMATEIDKKIAKKENEYKQKHILFF